MAFAKPSGLPVLPGGGYLEHTMLHILRKRFPSSRHTAVETDEPEAICPNGDDAAHSKGRRHPPIDRRRMFHLSPVHRLGRGTSGAMLYSTHAVAAAALANAMRERRIRKTYLALAQGIVAQDALVVETPIGQVSHRLLGTVWAAAEGGKPSRSEIRVLRRDHAADVTLLEVDIPTGRPHQIRIHCAAAGHPLAGDPLYGPDGNPFLPSDGRMAVPGDCGYLLHSWKIRFPDPSRGEELLIISSPPPALAPVTP
jgi:23S rRNA pseudouridine1911/1915/1917 synthase